MFELRRGEEYAEETQMFKNIKKRDARVVGYLRPVKQWNPGKQAEFDLRKNFRVM